MVKKILAITPTLSGGSWLSTEKIINQLSAKHVTILSQGKIYHRNKKFNYNTIPYLAYDRWGTITTKSSLINILWNLPVLLLGLLKIITYQPDLFITNGLVLGFLLSPVAKLFGKKTVVAYHSYIANIGTVDKAVMSFLSNFVDIVVANSTGSYKDIAQVVHKKKVLINEHFADDVFFKIPVERKTEIFTVLYVGRLDEDKLCYPLIKIAERLKNDPDIRFRFAGVGQYDHLLKVLADSYKNILYEGYVKDRTFLAKLYRDADVVWSVADTTYLAIPAVEALASGTPIIVPNIPGLGEDNQKDARIGTTVVPTDIGWIIKPRKLDEIYQLLLKIKANGVSTTTRKSCRLYAQKKYNKTNLTNTVKAIQSLFDLL